LASQTCTALYLLPFIPGGTIAALGPGVAGLKEGDPVGLAWLHDICGACEYCRTGWDSLCLAQRNSGYSGSGSFAEYAMAPRPISDDCRQSEFRGFGADSLRRCHHLQRH